MVKVLITAKNYLFHYFEFFKVLWYLEIFTYYKNNGSFALWPPYDPHPIVSVLLNSIFFGFHKFPALRFK